MGLQDSKGIPVEWTQRPPHPKDIQLLQAQLKAWQEQQTEVKPTNTAWPATLLTVTVNIMTKRFCLDLRLLNPRGRRLEVFMGSIETNLKLPQLNSIFSTFGMPLETKDNQHLTIQISEKGESWPHRIISTLKADCLPYYARFRHKLVSKLTTGSILSHIEEVPLHAL